MIVGNRRAMKGVREEGRNGKTMVGVERAWD